MIKIRSKLFETNSSSSDVYEMDSYPDTVIMKQTAYIDLDILESLSESDVDNISKQLWDIENEITEVLSDLYEDSCTIEDIFDYLTIEISGDIRVDVSYSGGCSATRYEPGEGVEVTVEDYSGIPTKSDAFTDKPKYMDALMNIFNAHHITGISAVYNIYSAPINEEKLQDTIFD